MKKTLLICLFLSLFCGNLTAETPIDDHWRPEPLDLAPARWIWIHSGRTLSNTFLLFRREVVVDGPLKKATGWITADSRYLLSVNGERIQWGPAPFDPRTQDVDPIDLTNVLQEGANVIGAEVLFYGLGDGTWPAGKPGFIFQLNLEYQDGRKEQINSNDQWLVKLDRAHKPGQYKRWFLRALQEEFDARLHPFGWNTVDFQPDSTWVKAGMMGGAASKPASCAGYAGNDLLDGCDPNVSSLRKREIPLIREIKMPVKQLTESGSVDWKRDPNDWFDMRMANCFTIQTENVVEENEPGVWTFDAPEDPNRGIFLTFEWQDQIVGFPYFTIEAPEGTIVELMPQEAHQVGGNLWLDSQFYAWSRFICKEGINRFETYDFESLRWMQLHIRNIKEAKGSIKISNVGVRRRLYDWPNEPQIRCSEPELQRLFEASVNTLYNSCLDTCVDGMARERQQYSGDGGHQLLAVRSSLGETRLPKRFLRTFSEGQSPDGYFMDSWPAYDRLARVMQKQMGGAYWGPIWDHGVGFVFDCWNHYLETGDLKAIDEPYPRLVIFADYLHSHLGEDGLMPVEGLGIPTVWMDHIAYRHQRHRQCAFNLYVAAMLENALYPLAKAKNDPRAEEFAERGKALRARTVEVFWDPERKTFVNNRPWLAEEQHPRMDDRSLANAILFNQCPEGDTKESLRLLVESPPEMGYSYPCNACWRYWALCRLGRSDVVLKEFRERWAKMDSVRLNNTLAEDWHARPDSGSQWSHCAVSPLFILYSDIAGIRASAPGFKECIIKPQLGDLAELELTYYTPRGPIKFSAKKKSDGLGHHVEVHVPADCKAKLILPAGSTGNMNYWSVKVKS